MKEECFTILSQNGLLISKCKDIMVVPHSSSDYKRPYWIVTGDENEFILGCYETEKQAIKVIREIYECDGKYIMPMWDDVKEGE